MAKSPSRAPLIAAVILVLAVLAGFNALNEKYRPKSEKELEAEQAQAAKAAESKGGKAGSEAGKAPAPIPAPSSATNAEASTSLVQLGPDTFVGDKSGKNTVTIGWAWTPDVQGDPSKVSRAIDEVKKAVPNAQIRVVNTDEVSGVPEGVSVNGKVVVPPSADGGFPAEANAYQGVAATIKAGAAVPPGPK